jgi:hypothetical protein
MDRLRDSFVDVLKNISIQLNMEMTNPKFPNILIADSKGPY